MAPATPPSPSLHPSHHISLSFFLKCITQKFSCVNLGKYFSIPCETHRYTVPITRVRPHFRFGSENWSENFVSLGSGKKAWFRLLHIASFICRPSDSTVSEDARIEPQSTYICRVQSCVSRLPKYWPPTPFSTQRVCPPPAPKAGGTHSPGGEGGGGSIFWKTRDIRLTSYSIISLRMEPRTVATLALTAIRSNHLARSHPHG